MQNPQSSANASPDGYKWAVVGMLWMVCFFNYADRQAIAVVLPVLEKEFGFSKTEQGLISSAFMWVYAGAAPLAGFICDRYARRHLILGGCLFWSFVTLATAWCSKLWQFVAVRAAEGFGETFYFPASMSLTSDFHGQKTRSRALAFHQSSVYAGTILGSWIGALMAEHHGWRSGFYLFGGAGMVLAVILYGFLREPQRGIADGIIQESPQSLRASLADIFRTPTAIMLMVVFVGANFVATIFLVWAPTFLIEKFGYRLSSAGLSGTVFIHLASALAVPVAGWIADGQAQRRPGGRITPQCAGLLVGAGFVWWVGTTDSRASLLVAMTAFGICKGFYDSGIFASLYDVVPARSRGMAAGVMNTVGWFGGALGPLCTGLYADHGPHGTKIANMSAFISQCSWVYLVGGIILAVAIVLRGRTEGSRTAPH